MKVHQNKTQNSKSQHYINTAKPEIQISSNIEIILTQQEVEEFHIYIVQILLSERPGNVYNFFSQLHQGKCLYKNYFCFVLLINLHSILINTCSRPTTTWALSSQELVSIWMTAKRIQWSNRRPLIFIFILQTTIIGIMHWIDFPFLVSLCGCCWITLTNLHN
jgi:hypothetical protein